MTPGGSYHWLCDDEDSESATMTDKLPTDTAMLNWLNDKGADSGRRGWVCRHSAHGSEQRDFWALVGTDTDSASPTIRQAIAAAMKKEKGD